MRETDHLSTQKYAITAALTRLTGQAMMYREEKVLDFVASFMAVVREVERVPVGEDRERLAAFACERLRPILPALAPIAEFVSDLLGARTDEDEEDAGLDLLCMVAETAPSMARMKLMLEHIQREENAKRMRRGPGNTYLH